ncbi:unnamed protein product [Vitrella brassicaformis CCMP3155]|uniref:Uncharacterized protein n=1 Tax=Vitrella brassicaformis (strain CCMP3155) TaxID=1169540 RepID=A0A0G4FIN1_VITBC|nr:unnamed protein product [Vitrella brassicaformis CCMP3155]|eukprot:CEM12967.1 unnamed protein product [Vitrella brassicaformis CCMP3155]
MGNIGGVSGHGEHWAGQSSVFELTPLELLQVRQEVQTNNRAVAELMRDELEPAYQAKWNEYQLALFR